MAKLNILQYKNSPISKLIIKKDSNKRTIEDCRKERDLNSPDKENESPQKPSLKKLKVNPLANISPLTPVKLNNEIVNKELIKVNKFSEDEVNLFNLIRLLQEEKAKNSKLEQQLTQEQIKSSKLEIELCDEKIEKMELVVDLERVELKTRQISPFKIISTMEKLFSVKKTEKALTDIKFLENNELKIITVGRPPIYGESTQQFAHLIPYALIQKLLKSIIESKSTFSEKMELLIDDISLFFRHDKGICIDNNELEKLKLTPKNAEKKSSLIFKTDKHTYYLIDENFENIIKSDSLRAKAQTKYTQKKQKFIKSVLTALKDSINDETTKYIFCKEFANFMFILFNKKTFAAYPGEGNISESEIRLYETKQDALTGNHNFQVLTTGELASYNKKDLDSKLRVVANSGNKVKEALKGLAVLNSIFEAFFEMDEAADKINDYNEYNSILKLSNSKPDLKKYNDPLSEENVKSCIYSHIAKQAYTMYGLKALEENVLADTGKTKSFAGFGSAKGKVISYYELLNGATYRAEQRKIAKNKYPKAVKFRPEETDLDFLAEKAVDFISILISTFPSFQTGFMTMEQQDSCPKKIMKKFTKLIALDYQLDYETFYNRHILNQETDIIKDFNFEENSSDVELSAEYTNFYDTV